MKTSPRSLRRWVLAIFACAGALLPMAGASALSYPPGPGEDELAPGALFTVTFAPCEIGETVLFSFEGDFVNSLCSAPAPQTSGQVSAQAPTNPGVASAQFRAPTTPGTYTLTIVADGVTYTREVVVQGRSGGGGGGIGGIGTGGGLPRTGSDSLAMSLTSGAAAVITGVGVLVVAKRRSRQRLVV